MTPISLPWGLHPTAMVQELYLNSALGTSSFPKLENCVSLGCAWHQEPWDWSRTCGWLDLGSAWQVQCTWPWPQTCLITALLPYDLGFGLSHHLRFCPACLGLILWDEALASVPASHDIPVDFPALREMLVLAAPWEDRCPSTKWSLTNFVLLSFL